MISRQEWDSYTDDQKWEYLFRHSIDTEQLWNDSDQPYRVSMSVCANLERRLRITSQCVGIKFSNDCSAMIVPQFSIFRDEGIMIGRLLAGYGSLKSALSACVAHARNDVDMTIKAMFQARGETQRIDIADAIGRPPLKGLGIENTLSEAISDMRYCLKIRNQYAHCQWYKYNGRLCFVDMEEIAKEHVSISGFSSLTFRYLNTEMLTLQE